jgi:hypothetical protein
MQQGRPGGRLARHCMFWACPAASLDASQSTRALSTGSAPRVSSEQARGFRAGRRAVKANKYSALQGRTVLNVTIVSSDCRRSIAHCSPWAEGTIWSGLMRNQHGHVAQASFRAGSGTLDRSSLAVVIVNCAVLTAFFAYSYVEFSHDRTNAVPARTIALTGSLAR